METDSKGKAILQGTHGKLQVRIIHNTMVVQSKAGWKCADVEKAISDAKAGIVYDRS